LEALDGFFFGAVRHTNTSGPDLGLGSGPTLVTHFYKSQENKIKYPMKERNNSEITVLQEQERNREPISRNLWSFITVSWISPLLSIGKERALQVEDLYRLPESLSAKKLEKRWNWYWKGERTLWQTYFDAVKVLMILDAIVRILSIVVQFWALPFFVGQFVAFIDPIETNDNSLWIKNGYSIAAVLFCLEIVNIVLNSCLKNVHRSAMTTAENTMKLGIVRKLFRISPRARAIHVGSKWINYVNVDCEIVNIAPVMINSIWIIPIQLVVGVIFLSQNLGVALWPSFSILILSTVITLYSGTLMGPKFGMLMIASDKRIKAITEAIKNIKVIKYFALETTIEKGIQKFRNLQLDTLRSLLDIVVLSQGFAGVTPKLMPVIAFAVYSATRLLTPSVVFSSLLLFKNLDAPLSAAGTLMQQMARCKASWDRLVVVFDAEEDSTQEGQSLPNGTISIRDAVFEYPKEHSETESVKALSISNLDIEPGSLIGIVGKVGSGKSTLFHGLLKDLLITQGSVAVSGTMGYCSQKHLLFNGTIRDNIVFSCEMDEKKLENVITLCSLTEDLACLPAGVNTQLGENGASLSGGQMARVALARAMYQNPDIYLLDDPLSALDAAVGGQIFQHAILQSMKEKTVLLATHHLHYMAKMDKIMVVEGGEVVEFGTFDELMDLAGSFAQMMSKYSEEEHTQKSEQHSPVEVVSKAVKVEESIIKKETMAEGSVKNQIYKKYCMAIGLWICISFVILAILRIALRVVLEMWLAYGARTPDLATNVFILYYSILGAAVGISEILSNWWTGRGAVRGAETLHSEALTGILAAPLYFFESNPTGRILNRFTADTQSVDIHILNVILLLVFALVNVFSSLILVAQASWILLCIY
jgi:ABC-type multidrug transport system fused ATPase/permease subunit